MSASRVPEVTVPENPGGLLMPPKSVPAAPRRKRAKKPVVMPVPGVLVVVVGPEGRGKEMLLTIARRRFGSDASLAFPGRITTRPAAMVDADTSVSRREFRDMVLQGAFLCHWETGGQSFGLPNTARACLDAGRTVVLVAERESVNRFREKWSDVRVVEVKAGPDTICCTPGRAVQGLLTVHHQGDVADAVRRFHDVLMAMRVERLARDAASPRLTPGSGALRRLVAGPNNPQVPKRPRLTGLRPERHLA